MVIKKEDGRWYKNCPNCNKEVNYLRKNYAEESQRLGKLCKQCSNKAPSNNGHKGYYLGVLRKSFAHKYKTSADLRGIYWGVSFEYIAQLLIDQDFQCALTGRPIEAMELNNAASLDRIDSSLGYIEGNLQWVTSMVNMCKQQYTQQEFLDMCEDVVKLVRLNGNST